MAYKDKEKQRAFQRESIRTRRSAWLTENGPCRKCGSAENLEVDHIDRAIKEQHRIWSWSEKRRTAELAKCQVLCRGCHQEKTAGEVEYIGRPRPKKHGAYALWKEGCRCDDCLAGLERRRQWHRDHPRKRNA
jgi:5-methylcytosine-specific restriction endonuclease McrA